jgi:hypothetical protein
MPGLLSQAYGATPKQAAPTAIYGYQMRSPYESENKFFKSRPEVTGMAAEDGKIILNPYSSISDTEKMAVAKNEAVRLWIRDNKPKIDINLNDSQKKFFAGTEYAQNPQAMKETIMARIISGDPSANADKAQTQAANQLLSQIEKSTAKPTITQSIMSAMGMKKK